MIKLDDFNNPFDAILQFEHEIAAYTGAPYCVTTDCCTHALEIALVLNKPTSVITIPKKTYLSVPMLLRRLEIDFKFDSRQWRDQYLLTNTGIYDSARYLAKNMYKPGYIQCLSFGRTKPLEIGIGGCVLTDNKRIYQLASQLRSDGRDLFSFTKWQEQKVFPVGYHYTLRPEECVKGLNMLDSRSFTPQPDQYFDYPDCSKLVLKTIDDYNAPNIKS